VKKITSLRWRYLGKYFVLDIFTSGVKYDIIFHNIMQNTDVNNMLYICSIYSSRNIYITFWGNLIRNNHTFLLYIHTQRAFCTRTTVIVNIYTPLRDILWMFGVVRIICIYYIRYTRVLHRTSMWFLHNIYSHHFVGMCTNLNFSLQKERVLHQDE